MKLVVVALALVACGKHERGPIDREKAKALFDEVQISSPHGMSDLSIDDRGVMWAVAERDRQVLELELGKPPITHALEGVPPGVDTEGIAWLGDGRFAFALEGANEPIAAIAFGELRDGKIAITRTRALTQAELGVETTINHGIEAVCGNGDELLAAAELAGKLDGGGRFASLVRLRADAVHATKLRLTTGAGKISALHCTLAADGKAQVIAIERHYGVCRILRFTVGRDDVEVTPTVELDLAPVLSNTLNLEGIAQLPDGRLVAINDNQGKTASGPTELLVFHPR